MEFENNINERIEGRNAVIEALRAGRAIDKIYIAKGEVDQRRWGTSPPRRARRASSSWRPTAASSTP